MWSQKYIRDSVERREQMQIRAKIGGILYDRGGKPVFWNQVRVPVPVPTTDHLWTC